jgi:hypothetical protein
MIARITDPEKCVNFARDFFSLEASASESLGSPGGSLIYLEKLIAIRVLP